MKEMRQRFDEIINYDKTLPCEDCPCYVECENLSEEEYSCEDMFFAYITLGKNFDLNKEKILKNT